MTLRKFAFISLISILFYSCQTHRTIVPKISGTAREEFKLSNPIIVALKDSRASKQNSAQVVQAIQNDLKSIYGNNITFKSYFDKTDEKSVAIKINIVEIGSEFGIRRIQYQTYRNQVTSVSSSVSTIWGSAVSTAIVTQPVIQNNFSAEGYWVGTSYLEVSLIDNLHGQKKIYEFPFVGEDRKNNMLGYKTASIVAKNSWEKVSSHLLDFIDSLAMKMIEIE